MNAEFNRIAACACVMSASLFFSWQAGAAVSAPAKVQLKADESLLWHTAPAGAFTVRWSMPPEASSATLTVAGAKYRRVYGGLSSEEAAISLPAVSSARDENVYALTLEFDDGTVQTAILGAVTGVGVGSDALSVPLRLEGSAQWSKFTGRAVVPVAAGAASLTVNGAEIVPALDGAAGWRMVTYQGGVNEYTLALTDEDGEHNAVLYGRGGGFALILR